VETRTEPGKEKSLVRAFMRGPDESDAYLPAALAIVSGASKTPLVTLPSLSLLENHCYQGYQNSLIEKVQTVSGNRIWAILHHLRLTRHHLIRQ
jgi:hypothetical protein